MKKILIIKLSALGDVCLALPVIDVIINQHKNDDIQVLTGPAFVDFFINHPQLKVEVLDGKNRFGKNGKWGRILWTRREKFDVVYDLQGNRTSRLLVRFSGASRRVGTQPNRIFHVRPETFYSKETQQNIFDRLNETLVAADMPQAQPRCDLHPFPADIEKVAQWKNQTGIADGAYALFHAGCSPEWPSKQWPADHFLHLASMVERAGIQCVWIGGKEDKDINSSLAAWVGSDATAQFNLLQLYLLAKNARFAVTNDSGPMHVLALAGLPVYSFFGPTNWLRSHAVGQRERIFRNNTPCSPCFLKQCPGEKKHRCLATITPEEVFARISQELHV